MYAAIIFLAFAFGCASGLLIRRTLLSILVGAACSLPLVMLGLLYWLGSRSGCAGGDCGPAIMLLALLAIPAGLVAVAGLGLLGHGVAAWLIQRGGASFKAANSTAFLLLIATAIGTWLAGQWAFAADPAGNCMDRTHVVMIESEPVRFVVAREVSIFFGPKRGGSGFNFHRLGDAKTFCANENRQQSIAVAMIRFQSNPSNYGGPDEKNSGLSKLMVDLYSFSRVGPGVKRSICIGPFEEVSRDLLCKLQEPNEITDIILRRANVPFDTTLFTDVQSAGPRTIRNSAEFSARLMQLPAQKRVDEYTIAWNDRQWMIFSGPTTSDPLGLPRILASCSQSKAGFYTLCKVRFRISNQLAATTSLQSDRVRSKVDLIPIMRRLIRFALATSSKTLGSGPMK